MKQKLGPQAAFAKAVSLLQGGDYAKAERLLRPLLTANGNNPDFQQLYGVVCNALGRHRDAVNHCRRAVQLLPQSADASYNLGTALLADRQFNEAVASFSVSNALRPGNYDTLNNLGAALVKSARLVEAEPPLREAIALQPSAPMAWYNLGLALDLLDRHGDAYDCFKSAHERNYPDKPAVFLAMAGALSKQTRTEEALALLQAVVEASPRTAQAWLGLGNLHEVADRVDEAIRCFERGLAAEPENPGLVARLAYARRVVCNWRGADGLLSKVRRLAPTLPDHVLNLHLLAFYDDPEIHKSRAIYAAEKAAEGRKPFAARPPARHDRIRVAYVSSDFRNHAVATLVAGLFEAHDRSRFEIMGISYGPDDNSDVRRRLVAAFDRFVDVAPETPLRTAEIIRELEIDIAVDLTGYTSFSRLSTFAYRPAPIQASWLGYAGTTGASWIDYAIVDPVVVPPDRRSDFTEQLVYMPDCYLVNDDKRPAVESAPSRADAGLPADAFVFCCFNNTFKLTPEIFAIWMRLLAAVPDSVLWLRVSDPAAQANLQLEAQRCAIEPARLVFAPAVAYDFHLRRLACADLFLDTLPYGAHTTASDALWAGLPLVTCMGRAFAARVAGSLLATLGVPELAVPSLEDYEALALRLATDRSYSADVRRRVAAGRAVSPLFKTARFARQLESAYAQMYERWLTGQAPSPLSVAPIPT